MISIASHAWRLSWGWRLKFITRQIDAIPFLPLSLSELTPQAISWLLFHTLPKSIFILTLQRIIFSGFCLLLCVMVLKKRINATDNADMTFTVLLFIRLTVFFWKNKTIHRISFVVRLFWQLCNSGIFKDHQYWRHSLQSYSFFLLFNFFSLIFNSN